MATDPANCRAVERIKGGKFQGVFKDSKKLLRGSKRFLQHKTSILLDRMMSDKKKAYKVSVTETLGAYNLARRSHILHTIFNVSNFIISTAAALIFSQVYPGVSVSSGRCLLYANVVINKEEGVGNHYVQKSITKVADSACNFTLYSVVSSIIVSFILSWFLILLKPKKDCFVYRKSSSPSANLVVPCAIIAIIYSCIIMVAASILSTGFSQWCSSIHESSSLSCYKVDSLNITNYPFQSDKPNYRPIYLLLILSQVLIWLVFLMWVLFLASLLLRLAYHLDYPSYFFSPSSTVTNSKANSAQVLNASPGRLDNSLYGSMQETSFDTVTTTSDLTCDTMTSISPQPESKATSI